MANDFQDRIGQILGSDSARQLAGSALNELLRSRQQSGGSSGGGDGKSGRGLSGAGGLIAGAGAAALAPLAAKGIGKLVGGDGVGSLADAPQKLADAPKKLAGEATSKLGDTVEGKLKDKVEEAGGPSGMLKDTLKNALPFGGGGGGGSGKQDTEGVGKGRRMPIQQYYDIGLPVETVYNQWTQFEEWPKFMHRVTRVSQEDPCKVNFTVKIWAKTKEFTAEIETQRPNDRIKWKTTQGMSHTGVVMFRELGPNLTRVMLSFDVKPGSLIEKYARGTRYVKRAARADFHRFVAFIEMLENETGAWRGVIEEGELVEDHDPSYDEQREYGSADELVHGRGSEEDEDEESDKEDEDDEGRDGGDPESRRSSRSSGQSRSGGRSGSQGSRGGRAQAQRSSSRRSSAGGSGSSQRTSGSASGRSSGSKSRSSGSSSGSRSSGGSSSASRSSGSRSSGRASSGRSSSRSGSSGGGGSSSGRSRSGSSRSSRSSSSERQGRQRTGSSGRS